MFHKRYIIFNAGTYPKDEIFFSKIIPALVIFSYFMMWAANLEIQDTRIFITNFRPT